MNVATFCCTRASWFCLMKSRVKLFRTKTIVSNFVHLLVLNQKIIIVRKSSPVSSAFCCKWLFKTFSSNTASTKILKRIKIMGKVVFKQKCANLSLTNLIYPPLSIFDHVKAISYVCCGVDTMKIVQVSYNTYLTVEDIVTHTCTLTQKYNRSKKEEAQSHFGYNCRQTTLLSLSLIFCSLLLKRLVKCRQIFVQEQR